ncbi:MAG: pantetheine-phosphate adenylyltransferase [Calditrichota bacterium]
MTRTAVYPGTFDPITFGHIDVIRRASDLFDRVIVTLAINSNKQTLFTIEERRAQITRAVEDIPHVEVAECRGLIVDFALQQKAVAIIRGVRAVSDFDYEFQMALTNRKLAEAITTVFLMPHERFAYLNSSIVREVARLGGRVDCFVPDFVAAELKQKFGRSD